MPPLSKKRKAQQDSEEELELDHEGGLGGADSDVADSDVEEELVIEEDALARLMAIANSIDSDSEEPHFKYHSKKARNSSGEQQRDML
ncbi:hypothetical protein L211DRAFT_842697, partial [Terfezia boudieri ATCC MYA-4762]